MVNYSFGEIEKIIMMQAEKDFEKKMAAKRLGDKKRRPKLRGERNETKYQ